jgi:hypothetical protein
VPRATDMQSVSILNLSTPYHCLSARRRLKNSALEHNQTRRRQKSADALPYPVDAYELDVLQFLIDKADKATSSVVVTAGEIAAARNRGRKRITIQHADGRKEWAAAPKTKRPPGESRAYLALSRLEAAGFLLREHKPCDWYKGRPRAIKNKITLLAFEGVRPLPQRPAPKDCETSTTAIADVAAAAAAEPAIAPAGGDFSVPDDSTACGSPSTPRVDDLCLVASNVPNPHKPPMGGSGAPKARDEAAHAPQEGASASPTESAPPHGPPAGGTETTPRPRAADVPERRSAAPTAQEREATRGKEHGAGQMATRVLAYFVAKLLPGSAAIDTRHRRRIIAARCRDVLAGPQADRGEELLLAAVDGAPLDPLFREVDRRWLCKWVFSRIEQVEHLAELARRHKARVSSATAAPSRPPTPPVTPTRAELAESREKAQQLLEMLELLDRGTPPTVAQLIAAEKRRGC